MPKNNGKKKNLSAVEKLLQAQGYTAPPPQETVTSDPGKTSSQKRGGNNNYGKSPETDRLGWLPGKLLRERIKLREANDFDYLLVPPGGDLDFGVRMVNPIGITMFRTRAQFGDTRSIPKLYECLIDRAREGGMTPQLDLG